MIQAINKYLSSKNKLPHTCKDHLEVTKENVKNSEMRQFCSLLAQIEQSYPVLVQKYQFQIKIPSLNKLGSLHLCGQTVHPKRVFTASKQIVYILMCK